MNYLLKLLFSNPSSFIYESHAEEFRMLSRSPFSLILSYNPFSNVCVRCRIANLTFNSMNKLYSVNLCGTYFRMKAFLD